MCMHPTPIWYNTVQVLYHIGMLRLFLPLLLRKPSKAAKAMDVPPTPASKAALAKGD